jgi:hypothetical protein
MALTMRMRLSPRLRVLIVDDSPENVRQKPQLQVGTFSYAITPIHRVILTGRCDTLKVALSPWARTP